MTKLVFSTEKTINSKPIQVMERIREFDKITLKSHTVIIRDGKTTFHLNNNIPTGNNRPGHRYATNRHQSYLDRKDTLNALKQVNDLFLN
jgi:hypothetical protein